MILSVGLAWLGVGLLVLAAPARARQILGWLPVAGSWGLRVLGGAAFVLGGWGLVALCGGVLAVAGMLMISMMCASAAALLVPLWPRWYAGSVLIAGVVAALGWLWL